MSQANYGIKPIIFDTSSIFEAVKNRDEQKKQDELKKQEEKAAYMRKVLQAHIPLFIGLINVAVNDNKGEIGSNSDNGKYVEYKLSLGALDRERISKFGMLAILGKVYAEFKNAGWKKFSISFTASELDHTHDRMMYGDALNYFTVHVRAYETFEPYDGVHVTDYGSRDECRSSRSSRGSLKGFYRLEDVPEFDSLTYSQLYQR